MNKQELLNLIKTGEGLYLEFKEGIDPTLGKEICAFANANGGRIILGVTDNGDVKGFKISNQQVSQVQIQLFQDARFLFCISYPSFFTSSFVVKIIFPL